MRLPPYRDDLEAMRARLDLLERAARDRVCERCAVATRRRPMAHAVFASVLGLLLLVIVFGSCAVARAPAQAMRFHSATQ